MFNADKHRGETLLTLQAYCVTALDTKDYLDKETEEEAMIALHALSGVAQVPRETLRAAT